MGGLPDEVVAALIAGLVAAAGVAASILAARRETDARTRELTASIKRLELEKESLRQQQLTEILRKRVETYPALWEIICVYGRNWETEGKPWDRVWARAFLKALLDNNAKNGVFFSTPVYDAFGELRTFLERLCARLSNGAAATPADIEELYAIIRGRVLPGAERRTAGLGSYLKDELGSYVTSIVSVMHPHGSRNS
jgi:hypothetical protein